MSLELAIKVALRNPILPKGRNSISRFGAVLSGPDGVYTGQNSYKTHPLQFKFSNKHEACHVHAETAAILSCIRNSATGSYREIDDLSSYDLYVARVLKDGTPALAKPCEFCQQMIIAFNIHNVEWTV